MRTLAEWRTLGLAPAGRPMDEARGIAVRADRPAGRREPEGAPLGQRPHRRLVGEAIVPNFSALLGYNAAFSYALAVAHLSDRLRGEPGFVCATASAYEKAAL
jgi:membrane-bound lytic murein transglycosylase B